MGYDTNIAELIYNIKIYLDIIYSAYEDLYGYKPWFKKPKQSRLGKLVLKINSSQV